MLRSLQGLTKILRAVTFAGHLAHPHQSIEVALGSVCDTWKHEAVGGVKTVSTRSPQTAAPPEVKVSKANKEQQVEMETRQEKKKLNRGHYRKQMELQ